MTAFELAAILTLDSDGFETGLDSAESKTSKFGNTLKTGLKAAAGVAAAALTAVATGAAAIAKESLEAYADYEQLVGGVETLFKDSAETVQAYADNAFQTAGMSANEYMETVTSFSASLITSLGGNTAEAAEMANMAITDMSDNANKMGTDITSIENAYQAFAKKNYTLLDNLKLGYGGSQEEMERLLEDATKLSGIEYDISSYADIVSAIHVIQGEWEITGTTAKEASTTISGSLNSLKSAWNNLLAGLGNGEKDIKSLVSTTITQAKTVVKNVIPVLKNIASALPEAIEAAVDLLPSMVDSVLPSLISAVKSLLNGVLANIGSVANIVVDCALDLVDYIANNIPTILSAALTVVSTLIYGIAKALPSLLGSLVTAVAESIPIIFQGVGVAISEVFVGLFEGITGKTYQWAEDESAAVQSAMDAIDDYAASWESVKSAQEEVISSADSESSYYSNLLDELELITDSNGRVMEGYEQRASFIANELSAYTGTEITLVDGVIQQYDTLAESVQGAIDKMRSEAILESQKEAYNEAIANQDDALAQLSEIGAEYDALQEQYTQQMLAYYEAVENGSLAAQDEKKKEADNTFTQLNEIGAKYNEAQELVSSYYSAIDLYESNYTAASEGRYDDIVTKQQETTTSLGQSLEEQKANLENQIAAQTQAVEEASKIAEQTNSATAKRQAENAKKTLEDLKTQLSNVNKEITAAQKTTSSNITSNNSKISSNMTTQGTTAGTNYGTGLRNGLDSKASELYAAGYRAGDQVNAGYSAATGTHSPSRVARKFGKFYDEGIALGIEDGMSSVYKAAEELGNAIEVPYSTETSISASKVTADAQKSEVFDGLKEAIEDLKNMKLYLDGDTLVGGTVSRMNSALGDLSIRTARGMA